MTSLVPTYKNLDFYPNVSASTKRYETLLTKFSEKFQKSHLFLARAPGRVNLIGDHIDYVFFSSLPMAIEADVVAAVGIRDDNVVNVVNTDGKYGPATFSLPKDSLLAIGKGEFHWTNYVKCGFLVAAKFLHEHHKKSYHEIKGVDVIYDGTVPTGGGLSSSAAISVCSALLFLRANGIEEITKLDLTAITVVSEHYLGVNTGGMDQCASIYGEFGKALLVHYQPQIYGEIFTFPVVKPDDMVLLISNTLVEANKFETAPVNYNLRVVEFAIAAELLAKRTGLKLEENSNLDCGTFRGFMDTYCETKLGWKKWDGHDIDQAIKMFNKMLELTEELYSEDERSGFSTELAASELGLSVDDFTKRYLTKFQVKYDKLKLYIRTKHVYSEALNVFRVLKLLSSEPTPTFLNDLGSIINDSQYCLQNLVNNSTQEIETVCKVALANGSYGSRVTGAGFGGSVVHVTDAGKVEGLKKALIEQYYEVKFPGITKEILDTALVITKPSAGASIVEI